MNKTKSLAFCGMITALHIIATILLRFAWVPGIELAILFLVPFFSCTVALKTDFRYTLIFSAASLLICGIIDLESCLLYILPTISVGITYGICVKEDLDGTSIVYLLTIVEFGLFFASSYAIKLISNVDFIETACKILHFTDGNAYLGLGFLLFYSFAQAFMVHIVTKSELKKIKIDVKKSEYPSFFILVLAIIGLISAFLPYKEETFKFFSCICAIVFALPIALFGYQSTDKPWIILAVQAVCFLAIIPFLVKLESSDISYQSTALYLIIALPPIFYGAYILFTKCYSKETFLTNK